MTELILSYEPVLRLSFFFGILVLIAGWEVIAPRRGQIIARRLRWPSNLAIVALNTLLLRLLLPFTAVAMAVIAHDQGWGIINQLDLPLWPVVIICVVVLDFVVYAQHVLFHAVPVLWRLHRMHHADVEFDVTTGARFHPIEIFLSMGIKLLAVVTLGVPALAVLIFEILLNATAMFNHGNIRVPLGLDRVMRWLVVTPDMHRVHHSVVRAETDSNFGFNLPWWDRLFGTYCDQPAAGHQHMTIGLNGFRVSRELQLDRMLSQPFRQQDRDRVGLG
jgi:sterol desaturase/sphingolipid hydroxylase (fatty acid hydroxylase superfamily)